MQTIHMNGGVKWAMEAGSVKCGAVWRVAVVAVLVVGVAGMGTASVIEDFEDGDMTEYSGDTAVFDVQTGTVRHGSYALWSDGVNSGRIIRPIDEINSDEDVRVWLRTNTTATGNTFMRLRRANDSKQVFFIRILNDKAQFGHSDGQKNCGSVSPDTWYRFTAKNIAFAAEEYDAYFNGSLCAQDLSFYQSTSYVNELFFYSYEGSKGYYDFVQKTPFNQNPDFNTTSVNPDPPLTNQYANYSAEVHDPDGTIQHTNLTLNGVCTVQDEKRTGTTPTWDALCTPTSTGWLNATLKTVDDAGAVTTTELNRRLTDTAPDVVLTNPGNTTYWKYSVPWDLDVTDSDSMPDETIDCTLTNDTTEAATTSGTEAFTDSSTFRADIGAHTFEASCTDSTGNSNTTTADFSVGAINLTSVSSDAAVIETANTSYRADIEAGDMVEDIETWLVWNGSYRRNLKGDVIQSTLQREHWWRSPIITQNDTAEDWYIEAEANITDFNDGFETVKKVSDSYQQSLYLGFDVQNISIAPGRVMEAQDVPVSFDILRRTDQVGENSSIWFNGTEQRGTSTVFTAPVIENNSALSWNLTGYGKTTFSFRDRQKTLRTGDDYVDVHDKRLTDCSAGSASQETALRFKLWNEENRTEAINGQAAYNFDTTIQGRDTDNFGFDRSGSTIETCIYPMWAGYRITGPVQFEAQDFTDRNYDLYNISISNETEEFDLYLLPDSFSTPLYFQVQRGDGSTVSSATIKVMRYFISDNSYLTVAKAVTDSEGVATTYMRVNEIYYKFLITKDGQTLLETDRQIITCQSTPCTKEFTIDPQAVSERFRTKRGFSWNCFLNEDAPSFQCTVNHEDETMKEARLQVEQNQVLGVQTQCDIKVQSTGSSMVCPLEDLSNHSYSYTLKAQKDGYSFLLESGRIDRTDGMFADYEDSWVGAMLTILMVAGFGLYSPGAAVVFGFLGLIAAMMLQLLSIGIGALVGIGFVGFMILREVDI